jgi:hypothetical protein
MRKENAGLILLVIGIGLLLAGCATLDLRQANHDLASLCSAKMEAVNNHQAEQEVTVNAALSSLADEAAAQGSSTTNAEVNRIAFYRIAATAAWQAGDAKVVAYAQHGYSLCTGENRRKVPRDCGMLSVIPDFASIDELTQKLDDVTRRASGAGQPGIEKEVVRLADDLTSRIESLLRNRVAIEQSSAHPKLVEAVDRRIGTVLCTHLLMARGLILQVLGDESAAHKKAQCDDYRLQGDMKRLGFSQQIAPCLPLKDPVKPEACP